MKWDIMHDRAKKVIDAFLDNAGYWQEREDLAEGLTEEEREQVSEEVAVMIASIRKRYKLDVKLPKQTVTAVTAEKEEPTEKEPIEQPTENEPKAEESEIVVEKPKRGRRPAGEKKETVKKPRAKKTEAVE